MLLRLKLVMGLAHVYDVLEIEYDVFETAFVTIALETARRRWGAKRTHYPARGTSRGGLAVGHYGRISE